MSALEGLAIVGCCMVTGWTARQLWGPMIWRPRVRFTHITCTHTMPNPLYTLVMGERAGNAQERIKICKHAGDRTTLRVWDDSILSTWCDDCGAEL